MNELTKSSQVLDIKLQTLEEAEKMIQESALLEGLSFWMRGKAYKFIKEGIKSAKEGLPEGKDFEKYKSFLNYFELVGHGSDSLTKSQWANQLISGFNLVEKMKAEGTPLQELPTTERQCRKIINSAGYKIEVAKDRQRWKKQREAIKEEYFGLLEELDEASPDMADTLIQASRAEQKEEFEEKLTHKPALANAKNDWTIADQIKLASKRAQELNAQLLAIIQASKALGEGGQTFDFANRQLNQGLLNFSELNETLTRILNK